MKQHPQSHGRSMAVRFVLIAIGWAGLGVASAQSAPAITQPAAATPVPSFEVVSIRPSNRNEVGWHEEVLPDEVTISGASVKALVDTAYGIPYQFVFGGPGWVDSDEYTITAKMDPSIGEKLNQLPRKERQDQINRMLRPLLEDRFKLKVRYETKQLPIYALVVEKHGPKVTPSPPVSPNAGPEPAAMMNGKAWIVKREPMSFWAYQLSFESTIGRKVVDETGLKGDYQFTFTWQQTKDDSGPTIFTALEEQLGLKLEPRKGPVETLVIEHVERPSEN